MRIFLKGFVKLFILYIVWILLFYYILLVESAKNEQQTYNPGILNFPFSPQKSVKTMLHGSSHYRYHPYSTVRSNERKSNQSENHDPRNQDYFTVNTEDNTYLLERLGTSNKTLEGRFNITMTGIEEGPGCSSYNMKSITRTEEPISYSSEIDDYPELNIEDSVLDSLIQEILGDTTNFLFAKYADSIIQNNVYEKDSSVKKSPIQETSREDQIVYNHVNTGEFLPDLCNYDTSFSDCSLRTYLEDGEISILPKDIHCNDTMSTDKEQMKEFFDILNELNISLDENEMNRYFLENNNNNNMKENAEDPTEGLVKKGSSNCHLDFIESLENTEASIPVNIRNDDNEIQTMITETIDQYKSMNTKDITNQQWEDWSVETFDISLLKGNQVEKSYKEHHDIINNIKENKVIEDSLEVQSSFSGLYVPTNDINEETNESSNLDEEEDEFEEEHETLIFESQYSIDSRTSLYLENFKVVFPHLDILITITKEKNVDIMNKIEKFFGEITKLNVPFFRKVDFKLRKTRSIKYDKSLMEISDFIENNMKLMCSSSKKKNDVITILDTPDCTKLYLQLLMNVSPNLINDLKTHLKGQYRKKEDTFKKSRQNIENLTGTISVLKDLCKQLNVPDQKESKLYRLLYFYRTILRMNNESDRTNTADYVSDITETTSIISKILEEMEEFYREYVSTKYINIVKSINLQKEYEKTGFIKQIKDFIEKITQKKKELKNRIKVHFRRRQTQVSYILYHLSFLSVQRLFNAKGEEKDLRNCMKTYECFINKLFSKFPSVMTSVDYNELEENQKNNLCTNEEVLSHIISYLTLNIIQIVLVKIDYKTTTYFNVLNCYKETATLTIISNRIQKVTELFLSCIVLLEHLQCILTTIDKFKNAIEWMNGIFRLEEEINWRVFNQLSSLEKLHRKGILCVHGKNHMNQIKKLKKICSLYDSIYEKFRENK